MSKQWFHSLLVFLFFLKLFLFASYSLNAQQQCGTDVYLREMRKSQAFEEAEKQVNNKILKNQLSKRIKVNSPGGQSAPIITLPIVFHIVSNNPEKFTDQKVAEVILDLNNAFGKSGKYSASKGVDTRIRFQLAKKSIIGGNTTGITRTQSHWGSNVNINIEDLKLKSVIIWNPVKYINIWLVDNIITEGGASFSCGEWKRTYVAGYADFPFTTITPESKEGIVLTSTGNLLIHEMGHYLGLYHTFEGLCSNKNCLTDGDKICDTPPDSFTGSSPCNNPINSCTSDTASNYSNGFFPIDVADQTSNFMDYQNEDCANQFTEGQSERMRSTIAVIRKDLVSDVITKPCAENIKPYHIRNNANPKTGETIQFINNSSGASKYEWFINGKLENTSLHFSRVFPLEGTFFVTMKAYNDNNNCFASYTDLVNINCGVNARFYHTKSQIASKSDVLYDTISLINNSSGATSYKWILYDVSQGMKRTEITSNVSGGAANDLNYRFDTPGSYNIKLIADNGKCIDSTLIENFVVSDPTPEISVGIYSANCYQQTKVNLRFNVCNSGIATVPEKLPVVFYDADPRTARAKQIGDTFFVKEPLPGNCCRTYSTIVDAKREKLDTIFAVVNYSGNSVPIVLSANNLWHTDNIKYLDNNIAFVTNFRFTVNTTLPAVTIQSGDTKQLTAFIQSGSSFPSSFKWADDYNLSCGNCSSPIITADTSSIKRVVAANTNQCYDTAYVKITVPLSDDYTITNLATYCAGQDSIGVNFTLQNDFRLGKIPQNLKVVFYQKDPLTNNTVLLPPVYNVPSDFATISQDFSIKISRPLPGNMYVQVNDLADLISVLTPESIFPENDFSNNRQIFNYQPMSVHIDTSICEGDTLWGHFTEGAYIEKLINETGCEYTRTLVLRLEKRPPSPVIIASGNTDFCSGNSVMLAADTDLQVQWLLDQKTITDARNNTLIVKQPGVYTAITGTTNGCFSNSSNTIAVSIYPVKTQTISVSICEGESYNKNGKSKTKPGTYYDTLKTSNGCDSIVITNLSVTPRPSHFLPEDTIICIGKTLQLEVKGGYPSVWWNDNNRSPFLTVSSPGIYRAVVIDRNGCRGSDSIRILYEKCISIQIPSAFTPNNDNKNDIFAPVIGTKVTGYIMQIWNRWGQIIFETSDYTRGWNGSYNSMPQNTGAYIYAVSFKDPDGKPVTKKGSVLLMR